MGEEIGSQVDNRRKKTISPAVLKDVIDSASSINWRTLIAIYRWTGCRKSEALLLRWNDILWDQDRINMPSPKTAHLGKPTRLIPLFSELKPYLDEAFEHAPEGSIYVVDGMGLSKKNREGMLGKNLDKPFKKIIEQAGHEPWPKLFQNLRVTRENELIRLHPEYVAHAWIGHTREIANKHYAVRSVSGEATLFC